MNNEETFDWKTAAKYWGEGMNIEVLDSDFNVWLDFGTKTQMFFIKDAQYRLRPEPVEPVKWARGAWWEKEKGHWIVPMSLDSSNEMFEREMGNNYKNAPKFWPARFDQDGFLIIPDEFKHLK